MPTVSIIMNVYNGAAFVRQALASARTQTYRDWEIIVWDDCSTDDTGEIIGECGDDRVRYFRAGRNTGLGPARQMAIRQARGKWLAFLDQDDLWLPHKLEKQVALAGDDPEIGIVYGRTVVFTADGRERDFDHRHEFEALPEGIIFERLFTDSCFIAMSSAMLLKSAVTEAGGIHEGISTSPDYCLYLAITRRYKARAVQEVVCRYRMHARNMTRSTRRHIHEEVLSLIDRWQDHLDPKLTAHRRRVHNSLVAVAEMRRLETAGQGFKRLVTRGSFSYLVSRPLARAVRGARRRVQRPYWTTVSNHGDCHTSSTKA